MQARKILALLLSAALVLAVLTGCSGTNHARIAASAVNAEQGENQQIEFVTNSKLTRALRTAVEGGGSLTSIRQTMLDELGLDTVNFTVSGMQTVKSGQYAAQVYLQTVSNASDAAAMVASEICSVIHQLPADGSYTGSIAMIQTDAGYYVAVLVYVVDAGTNSSSNDDDEPSTPVLEQIAVTANPTVTNYALGETFDPTGMVVTAYYSDGSSNEVIDYTIQCASFDDKGAFTVPGEQQIVITYQGMITSVKVIVNPGITTDNTYFKDGELDQIISRFEDEATERGLAVGTDTELQYTVNQLLSQQSMSMNFAPALQNALGAPVYRASSDGKESFKEDTSSISYCSFFTVTTGEPVERNGFYDTMFSGNANSVQGYLKTIQDMIGEIDAAEEEGHTNSYTVYISVYATRANYIRYNVLLERTRT